MLQYNYGEEINYNFELLKATDYSKLRNFSCGNKKLDKFLHEDFIVNNKVINEDGLFFKAFNVDTEEIIGIVSLASSGIVFVQTNYMKLLPAIKIDVFACDSKYQKLHFAEDSKISKDPDDHYYLSDDIMAKTIRHCSSISESYALVNYILLYADKNAYRFYIRNGFRNFDEFMEKENNMEINKNIPMYMKLS